MRTGRDDEDISSKKEGVEMPHSSSRVVSHKEMVREAMKLTEVLARVLSKQKPSTRNR